MVIKKQGEARGKEKEPSVKCSRKRLFPVARKKDFSRDRRRTNRFITPGTFLREKIILYYYCDRPGGILTARRRLEEEETVFGTTVSSKGADL